MPAGVYTHPATTFVAGFPDSLPISVYEVRLADVGSARITLCIRAEA